MTTTNADELDDQGYTDYVQRKIDQLYDREESKTMLERKQGFLRQPTQITHKEDSSTAVSLSKCGLLHKRSPRFFVGWQVKQIFESVFLFVGKVLRFEGQETLVLP
jgi:hypothetical protein